MAFTPQHYSDLIKLLTEHPEWRRELRTLLFFDGEQDLVALVRELVEAQDRGEQRLQRIEEVVERLTEAQNRSERRLDRVEAAIERLAEAQRRSEERLDRVEAAIERLAEAQHRTEERVEELAEAQRRTEERVGELEQRMDRVEAAIERLTGALQRNTDRIGDLVGQALEWEYERKAPSYFGSILQGARVFERNLLVNELEPHLSVDELSDALLIDLVVRGIPRRHPELSEVLLAIEISSVIDRGDVDRARQRAALLQKAGFKVIPAVAGEGITEGAEEALVQHTVVLFQNGRVLQWEEALETVSISTD